MCEHRGVLASRVGEEKEEVGGYYLKLENSMFIPMGCRVPERNVRCCSQ